MAPKKPRYTYPVAGEEVPIQSVTEVLSLLNKPALLPWAAKVTAAAFKTGIAPHYHGFSEDVLDAVEAEAKKAYRAKSTEAMTLGTDIHGAIDAWIQSGGIMSPEEYIDPKITQGLKAFLDYGETINLEIVANEEKVFGWKNRIDQANGYPPLYAGRFDLLAKVDGVLTMCDFKVSTGIWDEYWLQLEAYKNAYEQAHPDSVIPQLAVFRIDKETGVLEAEFKDADTKRFIVFWHLACARETMNSLKGEK